MPGVHGEGLSELWRRVVQVIYRFPLIQNKSEMVILWPKASILPSLALVSARPKPNLEILIILSKILLSDAI